MTEKKSPEQIFWCGFQNNIYITTLSILSSKQKLNKFFFVKDQPKYLQNSCACMEINVLVLEAYKKYSRHDPVP
jgi:hypothetical protein